MDAHEMVCFGRAAVMYNKLLIDNVEVFSGALLRTKEDYLSFCSAAEFNSKRWDIDLGKSEVLVYLFTEQDDDKFWQHFLYNGQHIIGRMNDEEWGEIVELVEERPEIGLKFFAMPVSPGSLVRFTQPLFFRQWNGYDFDAGHSFPTGTVATYVRSAVHSYQEYHYFLVQGHLWLGWDPGDWGNMMEYIL